MSSVIQNSKILTVDTSPAMLEVLKNFTCKQGYDVDSYSDPADASALLERQAAQSHPEFRCVMLGWPQRDSAIIQDLLGRLSSKDLEDLPLIIVCQEISPEITALTGRRPATDVLRWKEIHHASDLIDQLPMVPDASETSSARTANSNAMPESDNNSRAATEKKLSAVTTSDQPSGSVSPDEFNRSLVNLLERVSRGQHGAVRYSLLMLDIQLEASTGDRLSLGDSAPMCRIVEEALGRIYKRPLSLTYLGNGQFAFLLANRRRQDTLTLTRKILQVVPKMVRYLNDLTMVSHAAVVHIDGNTTTAEDCLDQCRVAVSRTRTDRRDNCALVLPLKKYLTALETETPRLAGVSG